MHEHSVTLEAFHILPIPPPPWELLRLFFFPLRLPQPRSRPPVPAPIPHTCSTTPRAATAATATTPWRRQLCAGSAPRWSGSTCALGQEVPLSGAACK